MLTRFVRIQLTIFAIASIIGVLMVVGYIGAPTLLGIGHITVTMQLPATGGLYRFSNVTYRGVQIGEVTGVELTQNGAKATLSLDSSPKIPADLQAQVRSISAAGEQYVDLLPRTNNGPYLRDGSVISKQNTTIPQAVGPMLDQVSALINSIPKDKLGALIDESFDSFNGSGYDLGSLVDSSAKLSGDLNAVADRTRTLVEDTRPLLDSQAETTDSIRTWARSLAGINDTLVIDDSQVRTLLQVGPGAIDEVSRLLEQIKPTLPVLLANLTTLGQVGVTYYPSLEQLLVLLPPLVGSLLSDASPTNNPTGIPLIDLEVNVSDPPPCYVGFLPPSQWRSPADTTTIDTPDGLYCKLPQDSPIGVRGVRNYPCMGHPGKRAPTVEICDSDKPYEPLAMKQHVFGPYPLDPNLTSQGIPPDDRVNYTDRIFGPVQGTPLPPGSPGPRATPPGPPAPAGIPSPGPPASPPAPAEIPAPPPPANTTPPPRDGGAPAGPDAGAAPAAPSAFTTGRSAREPSVAVARYNPHTGMYVTPGGQVLQQSDLVARSGPKTWKDMLPK